MVGEKKPIIFIGSILSLSNIPCHITYKGDNTMNFRTIEHYTNRINSLRAKNEVANAALIRKCQRRLKALKALVARG